MSTFREALASRLDREIDDIRRLVMGESGGVPIDHDALRLELASLDAGREAILTETEATLDAVIAAVIRDKDMRTIVKNAIRPDLVPWPTPWVRPRIEVAHGGRFNVHETVISDDEREARAKAGALASFSNLRSAADYLRMQEDVQVLDLAALARMPGGHTVAAWIAIGAEDVRLAALQTAARLAGVEAPETRRQPSDLLEVPGVGWIPGAVLALVGDALIRESAPARIAAHAARLELALAGGEHADNADVLRMLTREVEDKLERAPKGAADVEPTEGVHPLDEALAVLLEGIGERGKEAAESVRRTRKSRRERGERWRPYADPLRVPRALARALWADEVAHRARKHVALARVVHSKVVEILRPGLEVREGHIIDKDGIQHMLFTKQQALDVPTVEMGVIPRLLSRGVELLGSVNAHRVVRHLAVAGHQQVQMDKADARVLTYFGGWSAFAAAAKVPESEEARAIIVALAHGTFTLGDGTKGNLLSYTDRRGGPGKPGFVRVTIGDILLPHFTHSLDQGKQRSAIENRQLVPVVDFAPFYGKKNHHAAQASFQMRLMARFRAAAGEMVRTGWVRIERHEMESMARDSFLPDDVLDKVLDLWTQDGPKGPAFLVRDGDRYNLAEHFAPARAFLEAAGRMSRGRSQGGRTSTAEKGLKPRGRTRRRKAANSAS